jgi:serine/threonine-protein kinase RsbT
MIQTTGTGDVGGRLLAALTARVHLVDPRLRARIAGLCEGRTPPDEVESLAGEIVNVVALFGGASASRLLEEIDAETDGTLHLSPRDAVIPIEREGSVVQARQQAGALAAKLGFRVVQRTKIATATSELARNIHMYVGRGEIAIHVVASPRAGMRVRATDLGPGIPNLDDVLAGRIASKRGMGLGLRGVKAMSDDFTIESRPGHGTRVTAFFSLASRL